MLKVEKKISFIVAGVEFNELKTAQFFKRAINAHRKENEQDSFVAAYLIDCWRSMVRPGPQNSMAELVELVMDLQLPKPPKKKKVPEATEMEEAPGEHDELMDALDATFQKVSDPHIPNELINRQPPETDGYW